MYTAVWLEEPVMYAIFSFNPLWIPFLKCCFCFFSWLKNGNTFSRGLMATFWTQSLSRPSRVCSENFWRWVFFTLSCDYVSLFTQSRLELCTCPSGAWRAEWRRLLRVSASHCWQNGRLCSGKSGLVTWRPINKTQINVLCFEVVSCVWRCQCDQQQVLTDVHLPLRVSDPVWNPCLVLHQ